MLWDFEHGIHIVDDFPEEFGEFNFNPHKNKAIFDCTSE